MSHHADVDAGPVRHAPAGCISDDARGSSSVTALERQYADGSQSVPSE